MPTACFMRALAAMSLAVLIASCGGGGDSDSDSITAGPGTAVAQYSRYAYVANDGDGTVGIYTVDESTGRLRHRGYAAGLGNNPRSLATTPDGRFLFVGVFGSPNRIQSFPIDPLNGQLGTKLDNFGSVPATGMVAAPSGSFLYAIDGTSNVSVFTIDGATGALSAIAGSPYSAGGTLSGLALTPNGRFLYAALSGANSVMQFSVDVTTGSLTPGASIDAGTFPRRMVVDPSGRFLFVANSNSGDVSAYRIDGTTGVLTAVDSDESLVGVQNFPSGSLPSGLATSPDGARLFVANLNGGSVSVFDIGTLSGALTPVAGSPFAGYGSPTIVALDHSGKHLYVTSSPTNLMTIATIDSATGTLTPTARVSARKGPEALTLIKGKQPVAYKPQFAYASNLLSDDLSRLRIGASGALEFLGITGAGTQPRSVAADPFGRFVFASNFISNNVSAYVIDAATGDLTPAPGSPFAAGTNPTAVRVDPTGRFVYVSNYGFPGLGSISAYTINASDGSLAPVAGSPFSAGSGSSSLSVDPSGRFLYVTNLLNDTITAFSINPVSGVLTQLDTDSVTAGIQDLVVTNARPVSIAAEATGRFAYAGTACDNIWAFNINASTGLLSIKGLPAGGLCGASANAPDSVVSDPLGRALYTAGYSSQEVTISAIDATNGVLTPFVTKVGTGIRSEALDISGRFGYLARSDSSGEILQFNVNANGTLSAMAVPSVIAGSYHSSITTTGVVE